jgi:hypothetical protein
MFFLPGATFAVSVPLTTSQLRRIIYSHFAICDSSSSVFIYIPTNAHVGTLFDALLR